MNPQSLGEYIRSKREELDLSLRELAKALDITPPYISDIELGKRFPSEETLQKMAKFFKIGPEEIKAYDHRESVSDLKRLLERNPALNVAFRGVLEEVKDGTLTPEQLVSRLTHQKTTGGQK